MAKNRDLAELLLAQSPACSWVVSSSGVFEEFRGNPSALFGGIGCDLNGRAVTEVLPRESAQTWSERFARALGGESISLREHVGNQFWNVALFPIRIDGEIRYAGALASEIRAWNKIEKDLRQTTLNVLRSQELDRKMVAKFLHDSVGQNLTALGLQLDLVRMDLEADPAVRLRLEEVQKVLGLVMEDVREYSYRLNPSTVERLGLRPALDHLLSRVRERFPGDISLDLDAQLKPSPGVAPALFNIAQEAVENAVRHAGCSAIDIAVKSTHNALSLEVRDNGRGFNAADLAFGRRGLGLLSMEHYAAQAGLTLSIVSGRNTGTTIHAAELAKAAEG